MLRTDRYPRLTRAAAAAAGVLLLPSACSSHHAAGAANSSPSQETIKLQPSASFRVAGARVVTGFVQGLDRRGTGLEDADIRRDTAAVARLQSLVSHTSILLQMPGDHLNVGIDMSIATQPVHTFTVVQDQVQLERILGAATPAPAATAYDPNNGPRMTAIRPLPKDAKTRYGKLPIDANTFNLSVEACNNMLDLELDKPTLQRIEQIVPQTKLQGVVTEFTRLSSEDICNSYGLAYATKVAGVSYAEYAKVASHQTLQQSTVSGTSGVNLNINYQLYNQPLWDRLTPPGSAGHSTTTG